MDKLRSFFMVSIFVILPLALFQCGGSDTDAEDEDDDPADAEDAESGDVASASATSAGMTSGLNGSTGALANVTALLKKGVKNQQTIDLEDQADPEPIACPNGGTIEIVLGGTMETDEAMTTATLAMESTQTFTDCSADASVTLDDGSTCSFSSIITGSVTCTLDGTINLNDGSGTFDLNCSTTSECEGISVTLGTEEHTGGVNINAEDANLSEGEQPEFTGSVCIDGTSFTFEELIDLQVPAGELTCS